MRFLPLLHPHGAAVLLNLLRVDDALPLLPPSHREVYAYAHLAFVRQRSGKSVPRAFPFLQHRIAFDQGSGYPTTTLVVGCRTLPHVRGGLGGLFRQSVLGAGQSVLRDGYPLPWPCRQIMRLFWENHPEAAPQNHDKCVHRLPRLKWQEQGCVAHQGP